MTRLTRWLTLAALAAPLAAAPAAAQPRSAAQEIRDAWITTKVRAEYFVDPALKAQDISVSSQHGLVTLLGNVPDRKTRDEAILVARSTSGVKDVVDLLTVGAEPADGAKRDTQGEQLLDSDAGLASQVRMLLAIDPVVEPPKVEVSVTGGVVELTGTVNPIVHDQALEVARSVKGVKRVEDHLTVR